MAQRLRGLAIFRSIVVLAPLAVACASACGSNEQEEAPREKLGRQSQALGDDAAIPTKALPATADTYLKSGTPNKNQGSETVLSIKESGNHRVLVRFDSAAMNGLTAGPTTLELTIATNGDNWGTTGRQIAVHRMTHDWTELGATWDCSLDLNTSNSNDDCSGATAWEMGQPQHPELHPWFATPTAVATITNGQSGKVTFDVTTDVALFRSGAAANYGFLIKKVNEGAAGAIELSSRETSSGPRLIGPCLDANHDGVCDPADAGVDAAVDAAADADASVACSPPSCDDSLPCTVDQCTITGCTHTPAAAGTSCSDGNACNGAEVCNGSGACQAGSALVCNSGSPCIIDGCNPATGCTQTPVSAGTSCSDGNACNGVETCDGAGHCASGTALVCNSGQACIVDGCNPATGCTTTPAASGTSCSDGNACNGSEVCNASGSCQPGTPLVCNSHNPCVVDNCTPGGGCTTTPVAAGTSCSDGNACNGLETCNGSGTCVAGNVPSIDDGQPCTADSCDPATGVIHTPVAAGTSCSDGDACNGSETCDGAGGCAPGTAPSVDDHNPCTIDACSPSTGVTHTLAPAGTSCADTNFCNGAETCDASGVCQPGNPLVCNSGNACIVDSCAPATGCVQTAVPSCNPTPVQGENPFETRASLLGTVVSNTGAPITDATFAVYDEYAAGTPRSDVVTTLAADGSFRLRLSAFPDVEAPRTPPRHVLVVISAPGRIPARRSADLHRGDAPDLGEIKLMPRDPAVTMIGPSGGTASDSNGLVQVVIPAGALTATIPVQITPFHNRDELPAVLPDNTVTTYGLELEPSGTKFKMPVTVRLQNWRSVPTTLPIPTGSYDEVNGRWEHIGFAQWDGTRFAFQTTHFSTKDANYNELGTLVTQVSKDSANANKGEGKCLTSKWMAGGGSVRQAFSLPTTHVRGEDFGVSLHYDSGLAASRTQGSESTPTSTTSFAPGGVSMGGIRVTSKCVSGGGGGGGAGGGPGQCGGGGGGGTCSLGGAGGRLDVRMIALKNTVVVPPVPSGATDMDVGYFVKLPVVGGDVMGTGYASQTLSMSFTAGAGGAGGGSCIGPGVFGTTNLGQPSQPSNLEAGPWLNLTRRVLVHHRHASAFGAGWALGEVSRVYLNDDTATLVHGDGHEEEFHPRARTTQLQGPGNYDRGIARDPSTGEIFVAQHPGEIARLDPATGAATTVVSGLAIGSDLFHGMAITYVGSTRHFVVALNSRVLDVDASGAQRTLVSRPFLSSQAFNEANVAARGPWVFYTSGDPADPILHRIKLDGGAPVVEDLSASSPNADLKVFPTAPLQAVNFEGPRGLAFGPDGALYLAVPSRNVVYYLAPDAAGEIGPKSAVIVALGTGSARSLLGPGERLQGRGFPVSQPFRLSMGEDGILVANAAYGLVAYDTMSREAELLVLDSERDEVTFSLGDNASATFAVNVSRILATTTRGFLRIDVDLLSSDDDPTRTITPAGGGQLRLLDTTRATTWTFDSAGRVIEQRKRTGELDMTLAYADAQSDRVTSVTDALGGATTFSYSGGKLSAITDQRGRVTNVSVNGAGDLVSFTHPDGETYSFGYDEHHMTSKTTPRGDVTSYFFGTDGTLATSIKPGGETYQLIAAYSQPATYDASGKLQHSGSYVDARGVSHILDLDDKGMIRKETYVADGVTRVVENVYAPLLGDAGEVSARKNTLFRMAYQTVNGVPLSPGNMAFDSFGRPRRQSRASGGSGDMIHRWHYLPDGWLGASYDGPSSVAQRYERDTAGHVLRILDVGQDPLGDNELTTPATGRETDFTWRADGQPDTMRSHGVTTTFAYDDAGGTGNLTHTSDTLGRTTTLGYDARGNVTSVTDGTASSSFVFDVNNRLTISRDGFGHETTLGYTNVSCGCSESDEVTSVHTPDLPAGVHWSMTYGPQGRLASVTDPHDFTETYEYESTGELKKVTDRLSRVTTTTHDALGRVLSIVDTLGRTHKRSYPVPVSGAWVGASAAAGSPDAAAAPTNRSASLRSGEYQIGLDAYDTEGFPAQISFYRDATFALGYSHYFDPGQRLTLRVDRTAEAADSAAVPFLPGDDGTVAREAYGYEPTTSAPLVSAVVSKSYSPVANLGTTITRNLEHDELSSFGFGGGAERPVTYGYARDTAGRVTSQTTHFSTSEAAGQPGAVNATFNSFPTTVAYYTDGRVSLLSNADGAIVQTDNATSAVTITPGQHGFTYDARGQLATQTDFDGTYRYTYDAIGRNTELEFPDTHKRVQVFDDLGRITSRCYTYADTSLNRCYGAQYDAVGNPMEMTDPEGTDTFTYDALDRLTSVTRTEGGVQVAFEQYDYNALSALSVNAGAPMDHQRPKLTGGGNADSAVPNTFGGQPVTLDAGGRITSLSGATLGWDAMGVLRNANGAYTAVDSYGRRAWFDHEFYLYAGVNRVAVVHDAGPARPGSMQQSFLFDGVDHPLRVSTAHGVVGAGSVSEEPTLPKYYELDLAGNVRRLRSPGGGDAGGYRYTAFGKTIADTVVDPDGGVPHAADLATQPLRWKGAWRRSIGGVETYDMRARHWVPALGVFLSVDEYDFHDPAATLWGWPNQNPIRWSDPFGRSRAPAGVGGPTPLDYLAQAAFTNASDLSDFAAADWKSGNYAGAWFNGILVVNQVAIGVSAKALPFIVEAVAMSEGGETCPTRRAGPPNPYGRSGGPAHQAEVGKVAAGVERRGLTPSTEHHVPTPGGEKGSRFVDVVGKNAEGEVVEMHQVGRQTQSGNPVAREVRALDDIENATGVRPEFHPYNTP